MSGGAYAYLGLICRDDLAELLDKRMHLEAMATRLAGLGYARDAAFETEQLVVMLRHLEVRAEVRVGRLLDVWHAVEWWDSSDATEARVREALARYRGEPVQPGDLT